MITDGLSETYLIREKYVGRPYYHAYGDEGGKNCDFSAVSQPL